MTRDQSSYFAQLTITRDQSSDCWRNWHDPHAHTSKSIMQAVSKESWAADSITPLLLNRNLVVTEDKLRGRSITQNALSYMNAITTEKFASQVVTEPKFKSNTLGLHKFAGSKNMINSRLLKDYSLDNRVFADGSITLDKLYKWRHVTVELMEGTVRHIDIQPAQVTSDKLADNGISSEDIFDIAIGPTPNLHALVNSRLHASTYPPATRDCAVYEMVACSKRM